MTKDIYSVNINMIDINSVTARYVDFYVFILFIPNRQYET
jgi:hypothetical protein